eukprot:jgi/Chlat1/7501/Chrsp61S09145
MSDPRMPPAYNAGGFTGLPASNEFYECTFEELVAATSNFDTACTIGVGVFGATHKGLLGTRLVVVKRLHQDAARGRWEFLDNLQVLWQLHHPHIARVVAFHGEPGRQCTVTDYCTRGSLRDCLKPDANTYVHTPLPWHVRHAIAVQVASGLLYLHEQVPDPIIHQDIKSSNILLTDSYVAKLSDYALPRLTGLGPGGRYTNALYIQNAPADLQYVDPEFWQTGELAEASDIYSLGVVLLELVSAKPPNKAVQAAERELRLRQLSQLVDPQAGAWPLDFAESLCRLGLECTRMDAKQRPSLRERLLPELERLNARAQAARLGQDGELASTRLCSLTQLAVVDGVTAADGYLYERKAMQEWLRFDRVSPMTGQPLEHVHLAWSPMSSPTVPLPPIKRISHETRAPASSVQDFLREVASSIPQKSASNYSYPIGSEGPGSKLANAKVDAQNATSPGSRILHPVGRPPVEVHELPPIPPVLSLPPQPRRSSSLSSNISPDPPLHIVPATVHAQLHHPSSATEGWRAAQLSPLKSPHDTKNKLQQQVRPQATNWSAAKPMAVGAAVTKVEAPQRPQRVQQQPKQRGFLSLCCCAAPSAQS